MPGFNGGFRHEHIVQTTVFGAGGGEVTPNIESRHIAQNIHLQAVSLSVDLSQVNVTELPVIDEVRFSGMVGFVFAILMLFLYNFETGPEVE